MGKLKKAAKSSHKEIENHGPHVHNHPFNLLATECRDEPNYPKPINSGVLR